MQCKLIAFRRNPRVLKNTNAFIYENFKMEVKTIFIKNLCCQRCITSLKTLVEKNNIKVIDIKNGVVIILSNNEDLNNLYIQLQENNYELVKERDLIIVDEIKIKLLEFIDNKEYTKARLCDFLEKKLKLSYSHLSKKFSKHEKCTIEKYYIILKIEKIKEMLIINNFSLSEISYIYNYSSVQALSKQFKTITGITVKEFKNSFLDSSML